MAHTALVCVGKVAEATANLPRVSLWAGGLQPLGLLPEVKLDICLCCTHQRVKFCNFSLRVQRFCLILMMTHFNKNSSFLIAKTACHFSTKILCFSLYEHDYFWLASKALKTSFPLWFYSLTFFVTVQRPLGNVTLNKTFFPSLHSRDNKGLVVEGKMNQGKNEVSFLGEARGTTRILVTCSSVSPPL